MQAFAYLIPEELFKMELEEGVDRVQITISVLRTFKQLFHTYRQRIPKYYRHTQTIKLWDFPATLVFQRSDCIMDRLLMIEVTSTSLCVLKMCTSVTILPHYLPASYLPDPSVVFLLSSVGTFCNSTGLSETGEG